VTVVAAFHDPLPVLLPHYLADVVTPDHDSAHRGAANINAIVRPRAREVVLWTGISAYLRAHVPAAPRGGSAAVGISVRIVPVTVMGVMGVMRARFRARGKC